MNNLLLRWALGAILWMMASGGATAQANIEIYMPVYGNWCGPQHPKDMSLAPEPVDVLDKACMRHDQCIAAKGDYNCGCDIALLKDLRAGGWQGTSLHKQARAIYDAIALVPCDTKDGTSLKQTMFAVDVIYDTASGQGTPMDVLRRWRALVFGE